MRFVWGIEGRTPLVELFSIGRPVEIVRHVRHLVRDAAHDFELFALLGNETQVVRYGVKLGDSAIHRCEQTLHDLNECRSRKSIVPRRFHWKQYSEVFLENSLPRPGAFLLVAKERDKTRHRVLLQLRFVLLEKSNVLRWRFDFAQSVGRGRHSF